MRKRISKELILYLTLPVVIGSLLTFLNVIMPFYLLTECLFGIFVTFIAMFSVFLTQRMREAAAFAVFFGFSLLFEMAPFIWQAFKLYEPVALAAHNTPFLFFILSTCLAILLTLRHIL